jgi:pantothenate kinase
MARAAAQQLEPAPLADPVAHLRALVAALPPGARAAVALAGVPGAGKTTLAREWAAALNEGDEPIAFVLSLDGFHLTRARLAAGVGAHAPAECAARRGAPWTFDGAALAARLRRALHAPPGEAVPWPAFDHAERDPREGAGDAVPPRARLLILEGIYALAGGAGWPGADAGGGAGPWPPVDARGDAWAALPPLLAARFFLDTPRAEADARLAARHVAAWGISPAEARARIAESDGPNGDLVIATRAGADFLVSSRQ